MKNKFLETLKDYIVITLASVVFTVAWESFMIPNGMSAGGLMGLCAVIEYATGGTIIASYSYLIINSALILLAVVVFGIGFGFKTIYCILVNTVLLKLFDGIDWMHAVPGNFLFIPERVLIPVVAGVLEAVGVGYVIRKGGSTGGTDIIALIINKYWPIPLARLFLVTDFLIITSILFLPGRTFGDMVYGYIMMVTFSVVIDLIVVGDRGTIQLMVFSRKHAEIADYIAGKMERGVTVLKAQGWFTKQEKDVLLVLLTRSELPEITRVIKETDGKAFMTVSQVGGVYGEGFEEIKAGISKKKKQNADS